MEALSTRLSYRLFPGYFASSTDLTKRTRTQMVVQWNSRMMAIMSSMIISTWAFYIYIGCLFFPEDPRFVSLLKDPFHGVSLLSSLLLAYTCG
jgi:hypothetical protein